MACGNFFTGSTWVQPTEIHAWNGSSWIQATEVHVYNGASWVKFFPCAVGGKLQEEASNILDTAAAVKISRTVVKTALELLLTSEVLGLTKKSISVAETANVLDTALAVKISRDIIKTALELLVTSETGAISITTLPPVVDSCLAIEDEANVRARVRFNPGNFCRSVRIDKSVDGNHSFHQNMNTTPNTTNVFSNYYTGTCPEAVKFHIHPFTASNQGGLEGNDCNTTEVILGTPACK